MVTQTCDLVRRCGDRQLVEVCPLVEVDESVFREAERGRRPNYALIPGVSDQRLGADLDRVMTVEKSVAEDEPTFENQGWDHHLEAWLERVPKKDRFINVAGVVTTLDDLAARAYFESDLLALEHLSSREG